jgi:hypothetical protein
MLENLTRLFIFVDDFFKAYSKALEQYVKENSYELPSKHKYESKSLSLSEIMTILISFHLSDFKTLKAYYKFLKIYHKKEFPNLCSYNRFFERQCETFYPFKVLFECISGECDGLSYIDATCLPVCHIKREKFCKMFKKIAKKSKSTMGWYYGFKMHLITNKYGHPISFEITQSTVDDRKVPDTIFAKIFGKLYGDRGYISEKFKDNLKRKGINLITALRINMKPKLITEEDNKNLKNRGIIESCFNVLKNILSMQHTRHRSGKNYVINLISSMCACCFRFIDGIAIKKMMTNFELNNEKIMVL